MRAPLGRMLSLEESLHLRVKILGMQEDLYHDLNRYEYKGGAFKGLTNAYTSPLEVLNLLLASDLVTEDEKTKAFRPCKNALIEYYNMDSTGMSAKETRKPFNNWFEWTEVFRADRRIRGQHNEPDQMQLQNPDGNVVHTTMIGDDVIFCSVSDAPMK